MKLVPTASVTIALVACAQVVDASSLRSSLYEQYLTERTAGSFGFMTGCPNGYAVNSLCSSGRNADCNGMVTRISCTNDRRSDLLSQHGEPYIVKSKTWGDYASCGENEVVVGVCSSGRHADCNYDGRTPTAIGCFRLAPNYYLSTLTDDISNQCCGWGQTCICPAGFHATKVCTAGVNPDCARDICAHRGHIFTGMKCVKVVKREDLVVDAQWDDIGNTVKDSTYEVSFFNEEGVSTTNSQTVSREISVSLEISADVKMVSVSGSVTSTFSESFTNEVTQDIRHSITETITTSCSPRSDLAHDLALLQAKFKEYKGFDMPSNSIRYYKYKLNVRSGTIPRAILNTCDYAVVYSGMEPQCPPEACKDLPLCQTCCQRNRPF